MIGRIWRGVVREQDKDTYFEYLQETGIKEYASVPGNRGVWVLRNVKEGRAEFTLLTLWDSGTRSKPSPDLTTRRRSIILRTGDFCWNWTPR